MFSVVRNFAQSFVSLCHRHSVARLVSVKCMCTIEKPPQERQKQYTIPTGVYGQPTCHTHPHLIDPDHLTCGITQLEYKERRDTFMRTLIEMESVHLNQYVVIPAACKQYMSDRIPYTFRQNSDFFYLTGCLEPAAVLVMMKRPSNSDYKSILFVHEKDPHSELWEGPRTGVKESTQLFRVDQAMPIRGFREFIAGAVACTRPSKIWYQKDDVMNQNVHEVLAEAFRINKSMAISDPQKVLHSMRVIKSPAEVDLMRKACYIGSQAMNMAMACTRPCMSEQHIHGVLEYSCRQAGAEHLAFPPVVAGGPRATHIHYVANNQLLQPQEMMLVDNGCQRAMYNSDVSRTWPVNGKFSNNHRILYELVLTVQKRLIEILGQHRPALDQLFDQMCRLLGTYLQQEGIIPKNIDSQQLINKAYRLCPHHVSHYLGLDVHDSSLFGRSTPVKENMVVTVEPGLYIPPHDMSVPPEFRGIGIRIEDDVLITTSDPEVLTASCVKEVDEVEHMVGSYKINYDGP